MRLETHWSFYLKIIFVYEFIVPVFLDWGIRCISQNYKINVFCLFSECTPLHYAAKSSNLEMVRLLLENGADLRAADRHGWSVLHYAVR